MNHTGHLFPSPDTTLSESGFQPRLLLRGSNNLVTFWHARILQWDFSQLFDPVQTYVSTSLAGMGLEGKGWEVPPEARTAARKDTISARKQHSTFNHFSHDAPY